MSASYAGQCRLQRGPGGRSGSRARAGWLEQAGFTMIELIVVIVILGILAATALPKFVDLRSNSVAATVSGVAGALGSAMAVNYTGCTTLNHVSTGNAPNCMQVANCTDGASLLQGGLPASTNVTYSITAQALGTGGTGNGQGNNGVTGTCSLVATTSNGTSTSNFQGISAGN